MGIKIPLFHSLNSPTTILFPVLSMDERVMLMKKDIGSGIHFIDDYKGIIDDGYNGLMG